MQNNSSAGRWQGNRPASESTDNNIENSFDYCNYGVVNNYQSVSIKQSPLKRFSCE